MVTVGKMSAMGQIETQNGVARLNDGGVGFHVGLRSGMWLHVGMFGAKQLLGALAS